MTQTGQRDIPHRGTPCSVNKLGGDGWKEPIAAWERWLDITEHVMEEQLCCASLVLLGFSLSLPSFLIVIIMIATEFVFRSAT